MPIVYKIDPLAECKKRGWSTYRLIREGQISNATMQRIRDRVPASWETLATLCRLLECQPGDILAYIPDQDQARDQNSGQSPQD